MAGELSSPLSNLQWGKKVDLQCSFCTRLPSKIPSFNIMQNYTARNIKVKFYASISHLAEWMGSQGISAASYSTGA